MMSQQQGRIGVTTYRTHRAQEAAGRLRLRQRIEALEEEVRRLREMAHVLRECHAAIWQAISSEDGLDGAEGEAVLRKIEALQPQRREEAECAP